MWASAAKTIPGRCDLSAPPAAPGYLISVRRGHVSMTPAARSYPTARCIAVGVRVWAGDDDVGR
jgi:hypothetical protein